MNYRNPYTVLGWIARVLTPASMVIFLTMEIVKSQSGVSGIWSFLIPVAAFFTSIGIEFWGMLSGSNIEKAWQMQRSKAATAVQLVLYVALAMWMLRNNSTLFVLPIMASLVYVSAAMSESLGKYEKTAEVETRQSLAIRIRKDEAQAQRDHEARLKQMELDVQAKIALETKHEDNETAVKLARIEAKVQAATMPQPSPVALVAEPVAKLTDAQQRIFDAFREQPDATITDIAAKLGITRQAVSKQAKQMNGVLEQVRL